MKPPFPKRFTKVKREKEDREILKTFCKVEMNISLLDAIKQIPCYAKFLKELCTHKKKLSCNERINVGENMSAIIQIKLRHKCKDQDMFAISYKIGALGVRKAMCDLRASINVTPLFIYSQLKA